MRREERFSELSRAVAHDIEQRVCETSWEVLLVGVRPAFDAQADLGASRALGFDAVNLSYPGGEGPEDLAMNLVVRLLDPADTTVEWKEKQGRPNTERVYALLRKALERDFLDLKKSRRYKTTVHIENQLLKKERVRVIIEAFSDDPKAGEIVRLQLDPEGYNAFTNQELPGLLETSVNDIENRKKRVKNRLLQILRRQEKGTGTYV